jgi:hypothetical protein
MRVELEVTVYGLDLQWRIRRQAQLVTQRLGNDDPAGSID